jgi:ribokinase
LKPVTVVGSYNAGLTVKVDHLPRPGETVLASGFSEGPGGKGSNQAIAASRLGANVSFVGCVGRDPQGEAAFELWRREGVDARFVRRCRTRTGLGLVIVEDSGDNAITVVLGANMELGPRDVEKAGGAISQSGVLLAQLEVPPGSVRAAANLAKRHGVKMILNPAPAEKVTGIDLRAVDVLTPNEPEFALMTGTRDLRAGTRYLLRLGPSAVVVTLGEEGAYVATGEASYRVHAPKVKAVDTTGAGDAFNGALAVALNEGEPLSEAVALATCAGALSVRKPEVVAALPTRELLEEFRRRIPKD